MKPSRETPGIAGQIYTCTCGLLLSARIAKCPKCGKVNYTSIATTAPGAGRIAGCGGKTPGKGKKTNVRENVLQRECEKWLNLHGIEYLHLSPFAREKIGWPDLVFCCGGIPFAVELKSPSGVVNSEQLERLRAMEENGWRVAVCRSASEFVEFVEFQKPLDQAEF